MAATATEERFAALATQPEAEIRVAEAALWIAAEEYPDLSIPAYLGRLDELAAGAREVVPTDASPRERLAAFHAYLFERHRFRGNEAEYYDPRNSYLNEVLDRQLGIPISLTIVYVDVGRQIGLPLQGVSFPGHFLCKYGPEGRDGTEILIDVFHRKIVSREELQRRLEQNFGGKAEMDETWLAAAGPHEILARMLGNLKQIYLERGDTTRILRCFDRILQLLPDHPLELRDRGLFYAKLECFAPALRDLSRFLELAPDEDPRGRVRGLVTELHQRVAHLQ